MASKKERIKEFAKRTKKYMKGLILTPEERKYILVGLRQRKPMMRKGWRGESKRHSDVQKKKSRFAGSMNLKVTNKERKVLLEAMDVLVNVEQDSVNHNKLFEKIKMVK